jgi:Fe-S-cluster containining protein
VGKVTDKAVHVALLKPAAIEALHQSGRLKEYPLALKPLEKFSLPKKAEVKNSLVPKFNTKTTNITKKINQKISLKVLHNSVESPEAPCDTCKTSACCYVYLVNITEEEYESGMYGEYAVKLTHEDALQLQNRLSGFALMAAPGLLAQMSSGSEPSFFLEGTVGMPCPFLEDGNRCGIYDSRPLTCRVYTCVGDSRITQEMRDGTVDLYDVAITGEIYVSRDADKNTKE